VKPRLDGKFVSVRVQAWVPAASCIQAVHDELSADSRIIMNFSYACQSASSDIVIWSPAWAL
jgi:hypothetical protein